MRNAVIGACIAIIFAAASMFIYYALQVTYTFFELLTVFLGVLTLGAAYV